MLTKLQQVVLQHCFCLPAQARGRVQSQGMCLGVVSKDVDTTWIQLFLDSSSGFRKHIRGTGQGMCSSEVIMGTVTMLIWLPKQLLVRSKQPLDRLTTAHHLKTQTTHPLTGDCL